KLEDHAEAITQGIRTGSLKVYFNEINSQTIKENKFERGLIKEVFHGKNVKRYSCSIDNNNDLLLFPYKSNYFTPVDINQYKNSQKYLEKFKAELQERKDSGKVFKNTSKQWFEFWDSKAKCFESPKIVFPDISNRNNFYLDEEGKGYLNTCYAIFLKPGYDFKLYLGILNSKAIEFYVKKNCPFVRGGYYRYKTNYLKKI
ncbi:unnamed protein product, partial [marine sediment metagenome]